MHIQIYKTNRPWADLVRRRTKNGGAICGLLPTTWMNCGVGRDHVATLAATRTCSSGAARGPVLHRRGLRDTKSRWTRDLRLTKTWPWPWPWWPPSGCGGPCCAATHLDLRVRWTRRPLQAAAAEPAPGAVSAAAVAAPVARGLQQRRRPTRPTAAAEGRPKPAVPRAVSAEWAAARADLPPDRWLLRRSASPAGAAR
jgi:hypothetical protein